jgi:serine protease
MRCFIVRTLFVCRKSNYIALCLLGIALYGGITPLTLAADLPWYLGQPNTSNMSAAINALELVRAEPRPNRSIVVAVLDNGIDATHPSLTGKLLPGADLVSAKSNARGKRSTDYSPDQAGDLCPINGRAGDSDLYHGTKVASVIAGNGNFGITGVLRSVQILPVKVVGICKGRRDDLIDGIAWAAGFSVSGLSDNPSPAKVINISMAGGSSECHPELQNIINRVTEKNIIIVSAAGNTFGKPSLEPSVCAGVISIGAINPDRSTAFYSAIDRRIMLASPGGGAERKEFSFKNKIRVASLEIGLLGTSKDPGGADTGIGTSFAASLASGVIAGLALENPQISTKQVMNLIAKLSGQADGLGFLNYEQMRK